MTQNIFKSKNTYTNRPINIAIKYYIMNNDYMAKHNNLKMSKLSNKNSRF